MSQFNDHMNQKAVALSYDEDVNAAPVVVASGSGYIAQKIIETARSNGIPVYEDNSLATMLSQLELGNEIPEQLYQAIVEIYVYFLNFSPKKKNTAAVQPEAQTEPRAEMSAETYPEVPFEEYSEEPIQAYTPQGEPVQAHENQRELPPELTQGPGISLE